MCVARMLSDGTSLLVSRRAILSWRRSVPQKHAVSKTAHRWNPRQLARTHVHSFAHIE